MIRAGNKHETPTKFFREELTYLMGNQSELKHKTWSYLQISVNVSLLVGAFQNNDSSELFMKLKKKIYKEL